jgi:6-phosphofructokinase 2
VEPGGGGINVSRALHKLGGSSEAVYLSGGYTGKHFEELLVNDGVVSVALPIRGDTRENFVVVDESANKQYRFGMEGPEVTESEWQQALKYITEQPDCLYRSQWQPAAGCSIKCFCAAGCDSQTKKCEVDR